MPEVDCDTCRHHRPVEDPCGCSLGLYSTGPIGKAYVRLCGNCKGYEKKEG
jgi:hypothetical protein